jgi:hypothetical protein
MSKTRKPRKQGVKKKTPFKKVPDPKLPKEVFTKFLEDKISISEISNVCRVRDNFLWEKNGVQRFRINVWVEEYEELKYCPKVYIKHSFFVRYNKETKELTDHTIEQTIDLETMRKMF